MKTDASYSKNTFALRQTEMAHLFHCVFFPRNFILQHEDDKNVCET